ncbi:MAG: hypothetical protein Q9168_008171 [Polycauliona sp. 1 TL-2023]
MSFVGLSPGDIVKAWNLASRLYSEQFQPWKPAREVVEEIEGLLRGVSEEIQEFSHELHSFEKSLSDLEQLLASSVCLQQLPQDECAISEQITEVWVREQTLHHSNAYPNAYYNAYYNAAHDVWGVHPFDEDAHLEDHNLTPTEQDKLINKPKVPPEDLDLLIPSTRMETQLEWGPSPHHMLDRPVFYNPQRHSTRKRQQSRMMSFSSQASTTWYCWKCDDTAARQIREDDSRAPETHWYAWDIAVEDVYLADTPGLENILSLGVRLVNVKNLVLGPYHSSLLWPSLDVPPSIIYCAGHRHTDCAEWRRVPANGVVAYRKLETGLKSRYASTIHKGLTARTEVEGRTEGDNRLTALPSWTPTRLSHRVTRVLSSLLSMQLTLISPILLLPSVRALATDPPTISSRSVPIYNSWYQALHTTQTDILSVNLPIPTPLAKYKANKLLKLCTYHPKGPSTPTVTTFDPFILVLGCFICTGTLAIITHARRGDVYQSYIVALCALIATIIGAVRTTSIQEFLFGYLFWGCLIGAVGSAMFHYSIDGADKIADRTINREQA